MCIHNVLKSDTDTLGLFLIISIRLGFKTQSVKAKSLSLKTKTESVFVANLKFVAMATRMGLRNSLRTLLSWPTQKPKKNLNKIPPIWCH